MSPLGINRTDLNKTGTTYNEGTPVTIPHNFGDSVTLPHSFGNPIPTSGTETNPVTLPHNFGNNFAPIISNGLLMENGVDFFELENNSGIILLET
ncbi:MAG: hypothetical protein C5B59_08505 [Bacteroidetes bacterium]|nr:MAG: hypothetical protein C5B59_08505 [Bacteroidota bacterium]